ncbi:MAG: T9SS type A sorting domain-containing protein [Candidatus Marinimicrobia bacterium]|nr:T9SS type A sorting domain-containing protein [Candidatus Neomarinimicrobiota bacterium]
MLLLALLPIGVWGQTVAFLNSTSSASETAGAQSIGVFMINYAGNVTVRYNRASGTAELADYSFTTNTITFTGNDTVYFTVDPIDDLNDEPDETVIFNLQVISGSSGLGANHTFTITDDDGPPTVNLDATASSGLEGASPSITASLTLSSEFTITVDYTITAGSATNITDYSDPGSGSGTLTFAVNDVIETVPITIVNDALDESNETFTVNILNPSSTVILGSTLTHVYSITDDDALPGVQFSSGASSGDESTTPVPIEITLSPKSGRDVFVPYTVSGTADGGGTDYTLANGTVTISAGDLTSNISLAIATDVLDEDDETVIITLGTPVNAGLLTTTVHTFTITDDDALPAIHFSSDASNAAENSGTINLLIVLDPLAATGRDYLVDYATTGGTATAGTDYTALSGTATILEGNTSTTIPLVLTSESLYEGAETVEITLTNPRTGAGPDAGSLGSNGTHTFTIDANGTKPVIQFSTTESSGSEVITGPSLQIFLDGPSGVAATVQYSVTGGNAIAGVSNDFVLNAGTATISIGATTTTIPITINNESLFEANDTIEVTLAVPGDATLGANTVHEYIILNDDAPPTVNFALANSSGTEGGIAPTFGLVLDTASELDVLVDYAATDITATGSGTDYTLVASTLTIPATLTTGTITTATIAADLIDENSETFSITLSNPVNANLGVVTVHTFTINDNNPTPTIQFSSSGSSGAESSSPINPVITLSDASGLNVSVDYTVSGTASGGGIDYSVLASGTADIAPGETDSILVANIVNETIYENDETFIITLSNPNNADLGTTTVYTYSITNDDTPPDVGFSGLTSSGAENNSPALIALVLTGAATEVDVIVDYSLGVGTATGGGTDYTLVAGSDTIAAGQTTSNISITIADDALDEQDETIILNLSNPQGANLSGVNSHTYTILDDDLPPTVAFTALGSAGVEAVSPAQLEVALSAVSQFTITVDFAATDGSATGGVDYSLVSSFLTFLPGAILDTIDVTILDDLLDDGDETFDVTLSNPSNATLGATLLTHTFTIIDDDDPPVAFTVGAVVTTGGTVTAGFWNGTNTGVDITVPVDGAATLNGGIIQLRAATDGGSDQNLGGTVGIGAGDLGGTVTISVVAVTLEALTGFADGVTVTFDAIITDANTNSTTGTVSATTLLVDQADPAPFTVGNIATTGGALVADYWNQTNTGLDIVVPIDATDASLAGGVLQLQAEMDGAFEDFGLPYTVSSADITAGTVTLAVGDSVAGGTGVEELAGYSEGDDLAVRALLTDLAGNLTTATASASNFTVDTTPPTAALTYSDTLGSTGDVITITGTINEAATSRPQIAIAYRDNNVAATTMDSTSATIWTYDATLPTGNDSIATITLIATDLAGNALTIANTTGRSTLVVDNTPPGYTIAYTDSLVRVDDVSDITVVFEEPVQATPVISIDYAGTGSDITTQNMSLGASDSIWTFQITAPSGNDGFATLTVVADDIAGNAVVHISGGANTLKVDNMPPTLSVTAPADASLVNSTGLDYTFGEALDNGRVVWTWLGNTGVTDGASPHVQALTSSEIAAGSHSGVLTDPPVLVQGGQYSMAIIAQDAAGNADTATVSPITYDTLAPVITGVNIIDGAGAADLDSTTVRLSYSLSFSGYVEDFTGIALYEFSLGSTAGDSNIVAWSSAGTDTTATATGLTLAYKSWYYPTVRATDGAGNRTAHTTGDGVRIIDRPRVTLSVVQNSAVTNYLQVLVVDTLGMANSMALTINGTAAALTEIDSFTYVRSHRLEEADTLVLVATGTNAVGDSATTAGAAIVFARAARPWTAASLDANFQVAAPGGALLSDQLLVIADGLGGDAPGDAPSAQYVLGHGGLTFEQPVQVRMRRSSPGEGSGTAKRGQGAAVYHLSQAGQWVELPSMDEKDMVIAWTRRGGAFRLGERTLVVPEKTWLSANYPNPFNPSTRISFDLGLLDGPEQKVTLIVYNLLGQRVDVLVNGILPAGQHQVVWNGKDRRGRAVASGIYFVRLQTASGKHFTHKMALLK